jgi:glutamine synthetase adenylyltransferase
LRARKERTLRKITERRGWRVLGQMRLFMKDNLVALCEERGRKVNELADLLANELGRHPRSRETLEEVEQLLDNWAEATLHQSHLEPRTELQQLLTQCQELGERILDLEENSGSTNM